MDSRLFKKKKNSKFRNLPIKIQLIYKIIQDKKGKKKIIKRKKEEKES